MDVPGMRRLDYVRVVDDGPRLRFTAVGVGHRLPVERPLSQSTALGLVGSVPFVYRRTATGAR
jgi:hypothetical protein